MSPLRQRNFPSVPLILIAAASVVWSHAPAAAQQAYFSLTGDFQNSTDTALFNFDTSASIGSAETLKFITYHHSGGTNQAGFTITGGGFDPVLTLRDGVGTQHGINDDGNIIIFPNPNRDSYLTWPGQAPNPATTGITTDPLPVDSYELELSVFSGTFPSPWAVDLVGLASKMTLTGLALNGGATASSLYYGTTGAGAASAELSLAQFDSLTLNNLVVGNSGSASLNSLGLVSTGTMTVGDQLNSTGEVTLTGSGNIINTGLAYVGYNGHGGLRIEGGASALFQSNLYQAYFSFGQGDVTVTGNNSLMVVSGDLEVGDGGTGSLLIENGGWVNSSGIGSAGRDVIGDDAGANGVVTVTGFGANSFSTWDTDDLYVGDNGNGTLNVSNFGQVSSTNARIGVADISANGAVSINGPGSAWRIGDALDIGTTQISLFDNASLTINGFGLVEAGGATTINNTGKLNLVNGTLRTGSISAAGPGNFNWTAGTLDLTNSNVTLDSFSPDSVLGSTPTIGNGQTLVLSNTGIFGDLFVANTGTGSLIVDGGGDVTAKGVYVAFNSTGAGGLSVSGAGSTLTVHGDLEVGDGGTGSMTIELGGIVDSSGIGIRGRDVIGDDPDPSGTNVGIVQIWDPTSQWITDDLIIGNGHSGELDITDGTVTSNNVTVGNSAPGYVAMTDGHWQLGNLTVGANAGSEGTIRLRSGATIDSGNVILGSTVANGSAVISGIPTVHGSTSWNVTGSMTLGSPGFGRGTVTVEQDGVLDVSDSLTIAGSMDSAPFLTVRTAGEVTVANSLSIGQYGTANLQDSTSRLTTGVFNSTGGTFNWTAGTLEITNEIVRLDSVYPHAVLGQSLVVGAGQKLIVSIQSTNGLDVGNAGVGSLSILNGGVVESHRGIISVGGASDGTALVDGPTSQWNVILDLRVASQGNAVGHLTIQNGGTVSSLSGSIGLLNQANGTAVVDGEGSNWTMTDELRVGGQHSSKGSLTVRNGASVSAGLAFIGLQDSADGSVIIDGTAAGSGTPSTFNISSYLEVGGNVLYPGGAGSLTVRNSGEVHVGSELHVWDGGEVHFPGGSIYAGWIVVDPNGLMEGNSALRLGIGTLTNNGLVAPGPSRGQIDLQGLYTQGPVGELQVELAGGVVPGVDFDQLSITGSASLGGTLTAVLSALYTPVIGDAFPIINTSAGVTGRFGSVQFPSLAGTGMRVDYSDPFSVYLRVSLDGDLNGDGFVGLDDLDIVLNAWNQNVDAGVWAQGDPSGDGFVGLDDLDRVLNNWNAGTPPDAAAAIPEPGAFLTLILGVLAGLRTRQHTCFQPDPTK